MGGWIAAKLAIDHPGMVDRLVLDDSAGLTFQPSFTRTAFVPTDPAAVTRLMTLLTPRPAAMPTFVMRAILRRIARQGGIIQQSMDSMLSGRDLLDRTLSSVHQPTLIVWGAEDTLIPISVGRVMHQDIANSVFVAIQGCGHLAPGECAKPTLTATIQFLQAQPPPQGGDFTLSRSP
jgi:pimeloyl-ACP methyl ester carboxylesterase